MTARGPAFAILSWLAMASIACGPPPQPVAPPALDSAMFRSQVQPILERGCASPSCHGNDRRPLRVYAPGYFRADPTRLHLDEPISPDELAANQRSASAFALGVDRAEQSLLVLKPLGHAGHATVFSTVDDRDAQTVIVWLRTGGLP